VRSLQISDGHGARLGLNLGVRTYFSMEDTVAGRPGKRHRAASPGSQVPICQAEGCKADLSTAKPYHRRHKVCDLHSKAPSVVIAGQTQRFCQQCSRYFVITNYYSLVLIVQFIPVDWCLGSLSGLLPITVSFTYVN
jgi:hypothetical protein